MFDGKANPGKTCSLSRAKSPWTRKAAAKPMETLLPGNDLASEAREGRSLKPPSSSYSTSSPDTPEAAGDPTAVEVLTPT